MNFSKLLVTIIIIVALNSALYAGYFKDVPTNHWAYKPAVALSKLGILKGYPDGTFRGEQQVTRYQLAVALYNMVLYVQEYVTDKTKNLVSVNSIYSLRTEISKIADMASKAYKWSSENVKLIQELQKSLNASKVHSGGSSSQDINEILNEIISLKTEFDDKLQRFDVKYGNKISDLQSKVDELENKVDGISNLAINNRGKDGEKCPDYSREINSLKIKYRNLEAKLANLDKKISEKDNSSLTLDIYSIRKSIVELNEKYLSLENNIKNLSDKIEKITKSHKETQNQPTYEKPEIESMKKDLENLEGDVSTLKQNVKGILSSIKVIEGDLNSYKIQYSEKTKDLENEVENIKLQLDTIEVKIQNLEEKIQSIKPSSSNTLAIYSYVFSIVLFAAGVALIFYAR